MSQILRVAPDHPIVELIVQGAINDPESMAVIARGMKLQRETGIGDVLIDCSAMTHELTNLQIIDMATHVASLELPPNYRQSIVRPHDPYTAVAIGLWEAACNNRGIPVKVFPTRDEALNWLLTSTASFTPHE